MKLADRYHIVDGVPTYMIVVSQPDGIRVKYFYDPKTGFKVLQYVDAPFVTWLSFGDYRTIGSGIKIPFRQTDLRGSATISYTVTGAEVNTNLPDAIFK